MSRRTRDEGVEDASKERFVNLFIMAATFLYVLNYDFNAEEEGEMSCMKGDMVVSDSE